MIKEITVAGIKLNNYSAHEKLALMEKNITSNMFTVIENVYMRTLLLAKEDEVVKDVIESLDITEIADAEILEAVRANTIFMQKEIDSHEFFFQLMKRMERDEATVCILAGGEKEARNTYEFMVEEFPRIKILGWNLVDESVLPKEEVINQINAMSPDLILSVLPSPVQEHFLADCKGMISAKVWYGIGPGKIASRGRGIVATFWRHFRQKKLLKYIDLDKE